MLKVGKKIIVVALGGNALVQEGEKGTIQEQFANTRKSITGIVQCIKKGFDVVITHGNGPQVGNMLLRTELSRDKVPELPLGICVADTEGAIGYMIQQTMVNSLQKEQISKCSVTILTQVIVDKDDNAFRNPTKPIGPFFTASASISAMLGGPLPYPSAITLTLPSASILTLAVFSA